MVVQHSWLGLGDLNSFKVSKDRAPVFVLFHADAFENTAMKRDPCNSTCGFVLLSWTEFKTEVLCKISNSVVWVTL